MSGREFRRISGMIARGLSDLSLKDVADPRSRQGRRWPLQSLLATVITAMVAGMKSLRDLESLTVEMAPAMRKLLGVARRIPDTTVRDLMTQLAPGALRAALHRFIKAAWRRKSLEPEGLPFSVLAMDGKSVTTPTVNNPFVLSEPAVDGRPAYGMVRTITATLTSSRARVCVDVIPVPGKTNEMGHFITALGELVATYGRKMFRVITYDAGACSFDNAGAVISHGLDYLFALKANQSILFERAKALFAEREQPLAWTEDVVHNDRITYRKVWLVDKKRPTLPGLKTLVLVQSHTVNAAGKTIACEDRYFVSSLAWDRLTPKQWLLLVRSHWRVENDCHKTWDVSFDEDDKPWIRADPQGMVALMILRRIAYDMLALFRSVTQRSDQRRAAPWKDLLRWVYNALIAASDDHTAGLRPRPPPAVCLG